MPVYFPYQRRHALSLIPQPRLQFRQARGVRFKRAGARQFLRRLSAPPQVDQRRDAIAPQHGFIRLQRNGAIIGGNRSLSVASVVERIAKSIPG